MSIEGCAIGGFKAIGIFGILILAPLVVKTTYLAVTSLWIPGEYQVQTVSGVCREFIRGYKSKNGEFNAEAGGSHFNEVRTKESEYGYFYVPDKIAKTINTGDWVVVYIPRITQNEMVYITKDVRREAARRMANK